MSLDQPVHSNDTPGKADLKRLAVFPTVFEAHRLSWRNARDLLSLVWPWAFIIIAVNSFISWIRWPLDLVVRFPQMSLPGTVLDTMVLVVTSLAASSIAVSWHRFILLGEPLPTDKGLRLDPPVHVYFAFYLACTLIITACLVLLTGIAFDRDFTPIRSVALVTSLFALGYLAIRFSFILPTAAIEQERSWHHLWRQTHHQFWPLFFGLLLSAMPVLSLGILAVAGILAFPDLDHRITTMAVASIGELAVLLSGIVSGAFLSIAYAVLYDVR